MNYFARIDSGRVGAVGFFVFLILVAAAVIAYRYTQLEPRVTHGELIPLEAVDGERVEAALSDMVSWVERNQDVNGDLPYRYIPQQDRAVSSNNVIRRMITVQGLRATADVLEERDVETLASALESFVRAESYVFSRSRGFGYMLEGDDIKLGAAALTVLAEREGVSDRQPISETSRALGEYILTMQREDGTFQTFLQDEYTDENDRFYSGEALFALSRLYAASGDERYYDALEVSLPHYRELLESSFFPQYAPWHIMAYATAYSVEERDEFAAYVYYLADALIEGMLENDHNAAVDEDGRFYNPERPDWGPSHSSSTGVYVEGLTYAYELAVARGDTERAARYRNAILRGTRYLLQVQWTSETAAAVEKPEKVVGALRESITDGTLRVDQVGHALNALARVDALLFE